MTKFDERKIRQKFCYRLKAKPILPASTVAGSEEFDSGRAVKSNYKGYEHEHLDRNGRVDEYWKGDAFFPDNLTYFEAFDLMLLTRLPCDYYSQVGFGLLLIVYLTVLREPY